MVALLQLCFCRNRFWLHEILGRKTRPNLLTNKEPKGSFEKKTTKIIPLKYRLKQVILFFIKKITWQDEEHLTIPNLIGLSLRDALALLSSTHIHVAFSGSGRIASQTRLPGDSIALGKIGTRIAIRPIDIHSFLSLP